MDKIMLYRVSNLNGSKDAYFFPTRNIPYWLSKSRDIYVYELIDWDVEVIAYTLGGKFELFRGKFMDVPVKYLGFLSEIRIMDVEKIVLMEVIKGE